MHFARVLGPLVATAKIPPLSGYRLAGIEPTDARGRGLGDPLVAVDPGPYGPGEWVYFVTSREASLPLRDPFCAVDAAIVGKVDRVDLADEAPIVAVEMNPVAPRPAAPAAAAADSAIAGPDGTP
jgi:ethanolamine utilization protein EutN